MPVVHQDMSLKNQPGSIARTLGPEAVGESAEQELNWRSERDIEEMG